ncbi:hypothetical protein BRC81_01395 [Halobacteriales archaeon QS_1_68_20]|nr:MAG: hypothetical protein BRC81_01395 [Halobacteriales archaeon QS_1_68_20]
MLAGAISVSTAAADPSSDGEYPVHAKGKRVHHLKPLGGDTWEHRERFISNDLQGVYGKAEIELQTEEIARDSVPEKYRDPDRAGTIKYQDDGVFGTWDQHINAELHIHDDLTADHDYEGPLYVYKDGDLTERSAPVNTGWRDYHGFSWYDVESKMENNGWNGYMGSTDRYILVHTSYGSYTKTQNAHVKKATGWTTQWHGRLYGITEEEDPGYTVVGAFHHDPWDHGWLGGSDWRFAESRQECQDDWESWGYYTYTQDINNGWDYDSSNGLLGVI